MILSGYKDFKKLAEGDERVVYSALRNDGFPVVLKALRSEHPSPDSIALMFHEFEVLKNLDLPGVIKVYELLNQKNQYVLVQENMQGISLQKYLQKNPIKELSQFFKLALQMVPILGDLHQHHIIHKDLKPSNFIIQPESLLIKLTDFNFSSQLLHEVQSILPPSKLEGSLAYMAPEQTGRMNMRIDYRCDFYALGVTFFEMLSGHLPFSYQDPLELLHAHLANTMPELNNSHFEIPSVLVKIIQKLMAKNPSERYQSAVGLEADLSRCAKELSETGKILDFNLGGDDVSDRLNLSQKLYGREKEAEILLEHYEKSVQGSSEALMVCGYSGIGKTMLIDEVHKPMVKQKGYFINGKFDLLQRNTPYTAITQALNRLARLILAEDESRFAKIAESIKEALDQYGQILLELAPDFKQIIGPQPSLPKLTPSESQNQMRYYFLRFIRAMATQDHPLVIFIDDLQWADLPSLKLLEYILTDEVVAYLMVIGAYRDNEVDESHLLRATLKEVQEERGPLTFLSLKPLTLKDFSGLFEDSFRRKHEDILPLVELIYTKTQGNPFFCKQVISLLYRENILFFDYEKRQWNWDLEKIRQLNITDNVVDLMVTKLSALPEATQSLLKYAACIGREFTVEMLKLITGKPALEIAHLLWPALQEELLITLRLGHKRVEALGHENLNVLFSKKITYQFIHDRVQQAVYQGVSEQHSGRTHLDIARILLEKEPEACQGGQLFEVTDHFNKAVALLDPSEKKTVIDLNFRAGIQAFGSSAFQSMRGYIEVALSLCEPNAFSDNYEQMMRLNLAYVKSLALTGSRDEALTLAERLISKARNPMDRAELYHLEATIHFLNGETQSVVTAFLNAFNSLGVKIPEKPSKLLLIKKLIQIKWALRSYDLKSLDKVLPTLSDPKILTFFEFFAESGLLFQSAPVALRTCLFLESMRLMLKYGSPPAASTVVLAYGFIDLNLSRNDSNIAVFIELSDRYRLEKNHLPSAMASLASQSGGPGQFLFSFKKTRELAQEAIGIGFSIGAIVLLAGTFMLRSWSILAEGKSILEYRESLLESIVFTKKFHQKDYTIYYELLLTLIEVQMNSSNEDALFSSYENMKKSALRSLLTSTAEQAMARFYFFQENFDMVCEHHFRWYENLETVHYYVHTFFQITFDAIALSKCMSNLPRKEQKKYNRRFEELYKELKWAGAENPPNFEAQYWILEGVKKQMNKDYSSALAAFEKSIDLGKIGNFYLWVAVANECAADLYIMQGQKRASIDYIREAYYYYERYGLISKMKLLAKRYPEILSGARSSLVLPESSHTQVTTSSSLDFMSVIKASQTISQEILLNKLFEKMLHVVIENAGAEEALFLEKDKSAWMVTARLSHEPDQEKFEMLNVPLKEFENLPQNLIQYALRSEEAVVLANANEDHQYGQDPYILRTHPKSILTLPLLHQNKVVGLLYLENNLTTGAFIQDRVTVLTILASQIAISLENSHYFQRMEHLYRSTERFVPKKFLEILKKQNIEEVALGCILTPSATKFHFMLQ